MPGMSTTTTLPLSFVAGTTVKFTLSSTDYPASGGWTAKLYLAGKSVITPVTGSASGDDFSFTLSSAVTSALKAGAYSWRILATKAGEVYAAATGTVTVEADLAQAGEGDAQAWAEKALDLIEARLLGRYSEDMESFAVAGRSVAQIPQRELLAVRDKLREEIRLAGAGGQFVRDVRVTFSGTVNET